MTKGLRLEERFQIRNLQMAVDTTALHRRKAPGIQIVGRLCQPPDWKSRGAFRTAFFKTALI